MDTGGKILVLIVAIYLDPRALHEAKISLSSSFGHGLVVASAELDLSPHTVSHFSDPRLHRGERPSRGDVCNKAVQSAADDVKAD